MSVYIMSPITNNGVQADVLICMCRNCKWAELMEK